MYSHTLPHPLPYLQIFIVMAMLVAIMGWAATMAGLAVTVVMIPSSTIVGECCIRVCR